MYCCVIRKGIDGWFVIASMLSNVIGMIIPSILILVFCLLLIVFLVHRRSRGISSSSSSRAQEKQALIQLAAIVITHVVGYSVDFAVKTYIVFKQFSIPEHFLLLLGFTVHGILRVCECINPFLYYITSSDIRKESRRLIEDIQNAIPAFIKAANQSTNHATAGHARQQAGTDQSTPSQRTQSDTRRNKSSVALTADRSSLHSASNIDKSVVSAINLHTDRVIPLDSAAGGPTRCIYVPVALAAVESEWDIPLPCISTPLPNQVQ